MPAGCWREQWQRASHCRIVARPQPHCIVLTCSLDSACSSDNFDASHTHLCPAAPLAALSLDSCSAPRLALNSNRCRKPKAAPRRPAAAAASQRRRRCRPSRRARSSSADRRDTCSSLTVRRAHECRQLSLQSIVASALVSRVIWMHQLVLLCPRCRQAQRCRVAAVHLAHASQAWSATFKRD